MQESHQRRQWAARGRPKRGTGLVGRQDAYAGHAESDGGAKGATSRALAHYDYDYAGGVLELSHWWQLLDTNDHVTNTTGTNEQPYFGKSIQGNTCVYEQGTSGMRRGLKTSEFYWDEHLTGSLASGYTNSLPTTPSATSWPARATGTALRAIRRAGRTTDAANRTSQSCAFDALNRQTQCSGFTYTNDLAGNRTSRTNSSNVTQTYTWDAVNRLTNFNSISNCTTGADGAKKCRLATPTSRIDRFHESYGSATITPPNG